jgi:hypothetical protein
MNHITDASASRQERREFVATLTKRKSAKGIPALAVKTTDER